MDREVSEKYVTFLFKGLRLRNFELSMYNETLKKNVALSFDTSEATCLAMQRHTQADRN